MATSDNVLYQKAMETQDLPSKPFLKKELLYVIDNNGSNSYERNQIEFETNSLSSNSNWALFSEAFITIPFLATVERTVGHIDAAAGATQLHMKSGIPLIDKFSWSYNNDPVIAERDQLSGLVSFHQNTEFSQDDLTLKGDSRGVHKDSHVWTFGAEGLQNDMTQLVAEPQFYVDTGGKATVLPTDVAGSSGFDTYQLVGDKHIYRKDVKVFLKDLPGFKEFPMTRSGSVKITCRLNQGSVVRTRVEAVAAVGGNPAVPTHVTVQNTFKGSSCPILITSAFPGALACVETIKFGVGLVDGLSSEKKSCRLYIPSVTLEPSAELAYLAQGEKSMVYEDYLFLPQRNVAKGQFNFNLTNGVKRVKAILLIPQLSSISNGVRPDNGVRPEESVRYGSPACCSPCSIVDYNVEIAGRDVYSKPMQFRYENFQHELAQGRLGVNAGLEDGLCSGLISERDYNNTHFYLYTDLSQKYDYDELTNVNIAIRGRITSPLALDMYCYVIYEKTLAIDITTGAKLV